MKGSIFLNTVKHRIEETVHASLDGGFKFSSARWHTLVWNKDGVQPELILTHSHTDNSIYIYKPLAETLHWINTKSNQADGMGPNLVHSYPNHTKGASSLETGKPTQILGNWLHLSTLSDWRFINLNQSFEDALNLYPWRSDRHTITGPSVLRASRKRTICVRTHPRKLLRGTRQSLGRG